tara:strand:- start:3239 stop:3868 length:630 start_codon:yes stop_codon:yes gene_type:complete
MQNEDITYSLNDMNSQFNKELLALLCDENTDNKGDNCAEDYDNVCLISNTKLEDAVKLVCGHTFNYNSIFNEVKGQKKYNSYETQVLGKWQIKCPYCRTIQNGVLPFRNNYSKINGVNWPPLHQYMPNKCKYIFLSGKKKNTTCNKSCLNEYCNTHKKIMDKRANKINQSINIPTCQYIFKRGKNKGMSCKCKKLFNNSTHCKTHYKYI